MTKSFFNKFAVDLELAESGKWVRDLFGDGVGVKIRSTRSKPARDAQDRISKRNLPFYRRNETVPQDVQDANSIDLASALIADWENVSDENKSILACTKANKLTVLSDPRLAEFREAVIGIGSTSDTYRIELADDTENLSDASAPSSTPEAQPKAQLA